MSIGIPELREVLNIEGFVLGREELLIVEWGIVLCASLYAVLCDIRQKSLPDGVAFSLYVTGLAWHVWHAGFPGFLSSTLGAVLMALPFLALFLYAGGNECDTKLMAAVGAWLGLTQGALAVIAVLCATGVVAVCYALATGRFERLVRQWRQVLKVWAARIAAHRAPGIVVPKYPDDAVLQSLPYAVPIFCGIVVAAVGVLL